MTLPMISSPGDQYGVTDVLDYSDIFVASVDDTARKNLEKISRLMHQRHGRK
jgi:hypothetical protein